MSLRKEHIMARAWKRPKDGLWYIFVGLCETPHLVFEGHANCRSKQNVGSSAIEFGAEKLSLPRTRVKLVKVEYVDAPAE